MSLNSIAELISLAATVPTLILSANVIRLFARQSLSALRKKRRTAIDTLIMGIMLGFIGGFLDNLYWGFAWGSAYLDLDVADWLFENGVWSNIPFRQSLGCAAAYLHCTVDDHYSPGQVRKHPLNNLNRLLLISCVLGALLISILFLLKHFVL